MPYKSIPVKKISFLVIDFSHIVIHYYNGKVQIPQSLLQIWGKEITQQLSLSEAVVNNRLARTRNKLKSLVLKLTE